MVYDLLMSHNQLFQKKPKYMGDNRVYFGWICKQYKTFEKLLIKRVFDYLTVFSFAIHYHNNILIMFKKFGQF